MRNGDLVGTFRAPSTGGPFPGVLALGGSDGGTPEYFLNLLVPEGFACLAIAYWGTCICGKRYREVTMTAPFDRRQFR